MKKLIAIAIVAGFLVPAIAGAEATGMTAKGVKLGLNMATLSGSDAPDDVKMALGLAAGGFMTWSVNDMFAIQPEILFSQKGGKVESSGTEMGIDWSSETTMTLSYLDIPILAKLNIPMEGNVKPNVVLGPSIGINVGATAETEVTIAGISASDSADIEDVAALDLGLVIGAGVTIDKISVDARYQLGLTTTDSSEAEADIKNSVIQVLVGYSF